MTQPIGFNYLPRPGGSGPNDLAPLLPVRLTLGRVVVDVVGLVDTGSSFSVLPLDIGSRFGVPWASLPQHLTLGGAGGSIPARVLTVEGVVGTFAPLPLKFAWASNNAYPVLLGQANFLFEFDVCFFRRRGEFHIQPATP